MQARRPTTPVFIVLGALAALLAIELYYTSFASAARNTRLAKEAGLVRALGLTDTALFTEARYTRHPALADLNTPFQDHPMGFDHFPSGTIVPVPDLPGNGWLIFEPEAKK